ncbi:hypothetical protein BGX28_005028 [Mortierella sp. GBA30]|nr:hypothetical protein BGX28_005028 [Mortierella sp. GBA30]
MTKFHFATNQRKTIDIGDGLIMRWSTIADTENVGHLIADAFRWMSFGNPIPDDRVPEPNEFLRAASRRLLSGKNAVMSENDYALVEDTKRQKSKNPIVACVSLHRVSAYYGSVDLTFGKPELIATDAEYRNKGLVRKLLLEMIHPESEARGDVLQFIPGIDHFYRQFGYEYSLYMAGSFKLETPSVISPLVKGQSEPYILRLATQDDIPFLKRLSTRESLHTNSEVGVYYTSEYWQYTVHDAIVDKQSPFDADRETRIIIDAATNKPVGFTVFCFSIFGPQMEAMALDEHEASYVDVTNSVLRQSSVFAREFIEELEKGRAELKKKIAAAKGTTTNSEAETETSNDTDEKKEDNTKLTSLPLLFRLHRRHPLILTLGNKLKAPLDKVPSSRLYTRIPSYPVFIQEVTPELEKRIAQSAMAGVTGRLRLDFFRKVEGQDIKGLEIIFEKGKIVTVKEWTKPSPEKGLEEQLAWRKEYGNKKPAVYEASFHPLTFTSLVTGYRSLEELQWSYGDCRTKDDATRLLLNTLFPKADHSMDVFCW